MRVLYDYAAFMMQSRGGVSRVMQELISYGLKQAGVECFAWAGLHRNYEYDKLAENYSDSVMGYRLPEKIAKIRLMQPIDNFLFPSVAKRIKPDICHYTFFMTPKVPKGTKIVVTVHDLINELFADHYPKGDIQAQMRKKALSVADGVVCVSEQTKNDLLNIYDFPEERVVVAYNGNSMASVDNMTPPDIDYPYFLYVGSRDSWRKNFSVVLQAMTALSGYSEQRLVCFGGGAFNASELEAIQQAGLSDRVMQVGGSDSVLAGYYQQADALIYPSRYEGFGLPPVEAMTFQCPVIASSAPPMPEIIGDAGLFFDPECPEELSILLEKVLCGKKSTAMSAMIKRGIKRANMFTWEQSCATVHDFYSRLIS